MRGLWKELKDKRDWKAGYDYAGEIIRDWTSGNWSDAEIADRLSRGRLSLETNYLSMFRAGYSVRWQDQGARDAAHGSIQARKFKSHAYNMGWWNEMIERRKWGWRHERLDIAFERMQTLYWDRIADGSSDDYYSDDLA